MPKRIFIIDDVPPILNIIQKGLEEMGYEIMLASDGEEGWAATLNWRPDLIITDLMMPKLHGLDLLERVRNDHRTQSIPVLCMTSDTDYELKQDAAALGATGWIQKPFQMESWHATLKKILGE